MRLYKYKTANDNDMNALLENSLYVSTLDGMNDPLELGFYIKKDTDLSKIVEFQSWLLCQNCCISLSTTKIDRRLWNYYTDGMKGMVIEYSDSSIRKALESARILTFDYDEKVPKENSKYPGFATQGRVVYDGRKIDLTDWYLQYAFQNGIDTCVLPSEVFFHKDDSWAEEKEYRYIIHNSFLEERRLLNLVPSGIYIGYRMVEEKKEILATYCKFNAIPLYMYTPNFYSKSSKEYYKSVIYHPDGENDNVTELTE